MKLIRKFKTISLLGLVFILAFGMIGCGDDSNTSAVTNPNPNTLNPTGTIQGILTDACTAEPIVNAVIDIGLSRATTTSTGQFVIHNVPVTSQTTVSGSFSGTYQVTIDMRNVTSPVKMTHADTTVKYGDFYFTTANVLFSSLDDTNGSNAGGGSGSNHDTPVTGIVASKSLQVGKMATTITGVVAGCDSSGFAADFYALKEGATVLLLSNSGSSADDTASGNSGNLVASAMTDANGAFTFANVEAGQSFILKAISADGMAEDTSSFSTLCDNLTTSLVLQKSSALHLCTTDIHGPDIIAQSVENGADVGISDTQAVTFTFSEAVKSTAYTSLAVSAVGNLLEDIDVKWEDNKLITGGTQNNVPFTAAWNTEMTQLAVTFKTVSSGRYWVRIKNISANLTDANMLSAGSGICTDDDDVPAAWAVTGDADGATDDDPTVYFTTSGGLAVTAPIIAITNATNINWNSAVLLDWLGVSGAKGYNVYRTKTEVWSTGSVSDEFVLLTSTPITTAGYSDTPGATFVENGITKLTYTYTVTAVNSDNEESADSNAVVASDVIGPQISTLALKAGETLVFPGTDGLSDTAVYILTFNEPVDEASVEAATLSIIDDAGAISDARPVVTGAPVMASPTTVEITLTLTNPTGAGDTYSGLWSLASSDNVLDVAGNNIDSDYDLIHNTGGAVE